LQEGTTLFSVSIQTRFSASHRLVGVDGAHEPLHRHDWTVTATVVRRQLDRCGLVIDFEKLHRIICAVVEPLQDRALNELEFFHQNNPSAENVAKYIFDHTEALLPEGVELASITVTEKPGCSARYSR